MLKKDITGQKFGMLTAVKPTDERAKGSVVWECRCDCGNTCYVKTNALLNPNGPKSCGCVRKGDITGQKFGMLTAVKPTDERAKGSVVWECRCDCGNTCYVDLVRLKGKNRPNSCGCLKEKSRKDITGQKFGKLTAVKPTDERIKGSVVWECRCDCGNTCSVMASALTSPHGTRSCGCSRIKDISGQKFGKLTAVKPTDERANGSIVWECRCDCGNTCYVTANSLTSPHGAHSCGCSRRNDISGQKFGKLTAVKPTDERANGSIVWECRCDCGNTCYVTARNLKRKSETSASCGNCGNKGV